MAKRLAIRERLNSALPSMTFGVVAGISLVAQPVKFHTPELMTPQLVAVGATIFHGSHVVQWGLLLALFIIVPRRKASLRAALAISISALILATQQFVLTPMLEARLMLMKAGQPLPGSSLHGWYIALEIVKLASLGYLAFLKPTGR